jgi:hypothetical protein
VGREKKLALLLPFYKSTTPQTAFSIMHMMDRQKMAVMSKWGDAFIVHTRNALANAFVASGLEWSLWIDDDMIVPCGNAAWFNKATGFNLPPEFAGLNLADRLMSHGKTLVGGLYFGRNERGDPMYNEGIKDPEERAFAHSAPQDVVKPTAWVATGAMLVHRKVYLDIQARFPQLAPQFEKDGWHYFSRSETNLTSAYTRALSILNDTDAPESARLAKVKEILESANSMGVKQKSLTEGEDVTFCKRATAAGHQPHVDFGAVCGHVGSFVYGPAPKRNLTSI